MGASEGRERVQTAVQGAAARHRHSMAILGHWGGASEEPGAEQATQCDRSYLRVALMPYWVSYSFSVCVTRRDRPI